MGDDEGGAALHQGVHALLHQRLRAGIDGGGGLVQNHDGRIGHFCPGNGNELPLTLGELGAVAGKLRLVAFGQPGDKIVGACQLGGLHALLIRGVQTAVADIVHHRAGEQVGILKHDAKTAPQILLADLVDVDAVVADLAVGDVVESVDEVGDGGLACAGGADEGHFLTGMGVQGDVMQHRFLRHIAEVYLVHGDLAPQGGVGHGAVGLMGVLPGPLAGAGLRLGDRAVGGDVGIDQRYIAVIVLRGGVHKLEDPLRAGKGHDDGVDLVGHLTQRLIKGAGQEQEAHQLAGGEQSAVGHNNHPAAEQSQKGVLQIPQIVGDGAHDVGIGAGQEGILAQLVIQRVKILLGGFLVAEHLDHTLAGDHFLHIAVDRAQGFLLADEEIGGLSRNGLGQKQQQGYGDQRGGGEDGGGDEHGDHHRDNGHNGGNTLGNGLRDHLPQGVDIVGVAAHQVACGVGVKVADGQGLHMGKQRVPDGLLRTLPYPDHKQAVQEVGDQACQEDAAQPDHIVNQGSKIGILLGQHGGDVVIHQILQGLIAHHTGHGGDEDAHHHQHKTNTVLLHIAQQPQHGFSGILGLAAVTGHFYRGHPYFPPFVWD